MCIQHSALEFPLTIFLITNLFRCHVNIKNTASLTASGIEYQPETCSPCPPSRILSVRRGRFSFLTKSEWGKGTYGSPHPHQQAPLETDMDLVGLHCTSNRMERNTGLWMMTQVLAWSRFGCSQESKTSMKVAVSPRAKLDLSFFIQVSSLHTIH